MSKNIDPTEIDKFNQMARNWWDPKGECKPLHLLNPVRLQFIEDQIVLKEKHILDIGCGGGILAESMSAKDAKVTGIDFAEQAIHIARIHQQDAALDIDYHHTTVEDYSAGTKKQFDAITCLEMLEHVPDPESIILTCHKLLKPGGHLFLSTLNRNLKSFLLAIIGAEYVLRMLPRGTHEYEKFIKPSELNALLTKNQFVMKQMTGVSFNVISQRFSLSSDVSVNYLLVARKEP